MCRWRGYLCVIRMDVITVHGRTMFINRHTVSIDLSPFGGRHVVNLNALLLFLQHYHGEYLKFISNLVLLWKK